MKNQYFGDRRDYLKYSLIRALGCELSVAVCWLLTDDDQSKEGGKTDYLCQPDKWRKYDPPVYDFLRGHVRPEERRVDVLEKSKLLGDSAVSFRARCPAMAWAGSITSKSSSSSPTAPVWSSSIPTLA